MFRTCLLVRRVMDRNLVQVFADCLTKYFFLLTASSVGLRVRQIELFVFVLTKTPVKATSRPNSFSE